MPRNRNSNTRLNEITNRILHAGEPLKIVLFGSRAQNKAQNDSDYDFLIIEDSNQPRYKRAAKYRRRLRGMGFSKDIVVWTPEEVEQWRNVSNAFITTALREGIVLYER